MVIWLALACEWVLQNTRKHLFRFRHVVRFWLPLSCPALCVHLLLLSIGHSDPSRQTRPNHNIVKARLVFWFKSLFTLFAEYSSAVTGFRQTEAPKRGLPQADTSCWAVAETSLSLTIKWNPAYWTATLRGLHWGRLRASASPLRAWATLTLSLDTCVHLPPAWEPS